jgi:hypothetical protein
MSTRACYRFIDPGHYRPRGRDGLQALPEGARVIPAMKRAGQMSRDHAQGRSSGWLFGCFAARPLQRPWIPVTERDSHMVAFKRRDILCGVVTMSLAAND